MKNQTKQIEIIVKNQNEFLKFFKNKFPAFHNSNVFLRDIQYCIIQFLGEKGKKVNYTTAEKISNVIIKIFEQQSIFKKIDDRSWTLLYPEFLTPKARKNPQVSMKV